ncbi:MAG: nitroreductase family protein [Clostridia bacterium]|nr:nitroreductase family protein [Clostridia bacterium]
MDALYLIKNRKSVTTFNNKDIPSDIIAEILNCARVTPTRNYAQDWKFVVIKNKPLKKNISELCNIDCISDANILIAFFSKDNKFKIEYTSAAIEAMLIAANYYNVGVCWQATYGEPYSKEISALLKAPNDLYLMGLVALGYYDFTAPSFHKIPSLSEMVIAEKFK